MPVRENIGYGQIELMYQDDKIFKAASHAGINDLIEKLPESIETRLGKWFEGGHQLSGGQWQRIAIARSFMKDADIYIMDEPSSFLDAQSEEDIFQKFNELVKGRIGIFISHRLSSVRYADEIIVMDDGNIVEQGCHDMLMTLNQHYAKLYRLQQSGYVLKEY
ncbi:Lipid A export ATP-binding/permease protein MsbA [compost metagenome]